MINQLLQLAATSSKHILAAIVAKEEVAEKKLR